jgi:hypothetical protein
MECQFRPLYILLLLRFSDSVPLRQRNSDVLLSMYAGVSAKTANHPLISPMGPVKTGPV